MKYLPLFLLLTSCATTTDITKLQSEIDDLKVSVSENRASLLRVEQTAIEAKTESKKAVQYIQEMNSKLLSLLNKNR